MTSSLGVRLEGTVRCVSKAVVAAGLIALMGCGSGAGQSPAGTAAPSTAPSPEARTSAAPEPTNTISSPTPSEPAPTTAELAPLSLAVVSAAELNIRVAPSTSAALSEPFLVETPLRSGSRVLIIDGPIDADGYRWYLVGIDTEVGAPVAWVASGAPSGTHWLRPDETLCPGPDLRQISVLTSIQRLACFGSRSLTFVARQTTVPEGVGLGGACGSAAGQPEWLVCETYDWVNADDDVDSSLLLHFDPATGIAPTGLADPGTLGELWTIKGHFGDAAAQACGVGLDSATLEYRSAWLGCATLFVVEDLAPAR